MRLFILVVLGIVMVEVGCLLVLLDARPNAPLGFWLWFIGLALAAPVYLVWVYRRTIGRRRW
jgi:hypothetical protein